MVLTSGVVGVAGAAPAAAATVCNIHCDARDPALATGDRTPVSATASGRTVVLHLADSDPMGWASIEGGRGGDEVWLDRSFDGGTTWDDDGRLGLTSVPAGGSGWRTQMYNNDDWANLGVGALRACGRATDTGAIACTSWARTTWNAGDRTTAAATAMMATYDRDTGLFNGNDWWTSAPALSAVIENARVTGMGSYRYALGRTYDRNVNRQDGQNEGQFRNEYIDDTGWWAMVWLDAYDLTGEQRYLDTARAAADHMHAYWDGACGGGVYWKTDRANKASIANVLYLQVNASLHNRLPGDSTYLARAQAEWDWFRGSGLIRSDGLVVDGLASSGCAPGGTTFTYNQGVLVSGLVELHEATGDGSLLDQARRTADAMTRPGGGLTTSAGVLRDPAEGWDTCADDGASFKAGAIRGLAELDRALPDRPYEAYLDRQASTAHANARNALDQYGFVWSGPAPGDTGTGCQSSALAAMNAAH